MEKIVDEPKPTKLILYNTGARVAAADSSVIDDLRQLEKAGVGRGNTKEKP